MDVEGKLLNILRHGSVIIRCPATLGIAVDLEAQGCMVTVSGASAARPTSRPWPSLTRPGDGDSGC